MTKQIQIKKSSRHIFKIPFDIAIKKFDPTNLNHSKLAQLGREAFELGCEFVPKIILQADNNISKTKIQNALRKELKSILSKIDIYFIKDIKN